MKLTLVLLLLCALPAGTQLQKVTIATQMPPNSAGRMPVLIKYRSDNCDIQKTGKRYG
jgi:hypothetical protein